MVIHRTGLALYVLCRMQRVGHIVIRIERTVQVFLGYGLSGSFLPASTGLHKRHFQPQTVWALKADG